MYKTPTTKEFIRVLGDKISIKIDDKYLNDEEADGIYKHEVIYLRSYYKNRKEYLRVLRHETIHALCDSLGIQLDHHVEETLAHTISKTITYDL